MQQFYFSKFLKSVAKQSIYIFFFFVAVAIINNAVEIKKYCMIQLSTKRHISLL